ncbi:MAG: hypothetical protein QM713_06460 [Arachnia sp.]
MGVSIAPWAVASPLTVSASLYALPAEDRVEGALAAHAAGLWVHADVILTRAPDGALVNTGVAVDTILAVAAAAPGARLDVHVIAGAPLDGRDPEVRAVLAALAAARPVRWSIDAMLSDGLADALPNGEVWTAWWPPAGGPAPAHGGVLLMLIHPGSTQAADPGLLAHAPELGAAGRPVGIDGGVTEAIAAAAGTAGVGYVVCGRALFR